MRKKRHTNIYNNVRTFSKKEKKQARYTFYVICFLVLASISAFMKELIAPTPQESYKEKLVMVQENISVEIYGHIQNEGVFIVTPGTDMASLIIMAGGLLKSANINNIDLHEQLTNKSIYHIKGEIPVVYNEPLELNSEEIPRINFTNNTINILYVGLPGVFIIMEFNTDNKRLNITQIPQHTQVKGKTMSIVQTYLTLGAGPFIEILEEETNRNINYYFVQNRASFTEMIDKIGGVDIKIDSLFAESKNLNPSLEHIDGSIAYDYVSADCVDYIRLKGNKAVSKMKTSERLLAVAKAVLSKVTSSENIGSTLRMARELAKSTVDTNIDIESILRIPSLAGSYQLSFKVLSGYYEKNKTNIKFRPQLQDIDNLHRYLVNESLPTISIGSNIELFHK